MEEKLRLRQVDIRLAQAVHDADGLVFRRGKGLAVEEPPTVAGSHKICERTANINANMQCYHS